jgi:hypothetical protein
LNRASVKIVARAIARCRSASRHIRQRNHVQPLARSPRRGSKVDRAQTVATSASALARLLRDTAAGILLNEHVADDGWTGTYRSGRCPVWIKVRSQHRLQGERSEKWNR